MTRFIIITSAFALAACGSAHSNPDGGEGTLDSGPTFDAGPGTSPDSGPVDCEVPGVIETVSCGACGTQERTCSADGLWVSGPCMAEGECVPGTTGPVACGSCGTRTALCTAECAWDDSGTCESEGECTPGEMMTTGDGCGPSETRELMCNAACVFEESMGCTGEPCPTAGLIETIPCGMCGTVERFCNSSTVWEYGACTGEGVCVPGTTGSSPCGMCGTEPARCDDMCAWIPSGGACTGEGLCAPGEMTRTSAGCPAGETRPMTCGATCAFAPAGACTAITPVDVTFLLDMTGSHARRVIDNAAALMARCIDPLLAVADVSVGVSYYADFPGSPWGSATDVPFRGGIEPTTTRTTIEPAVSAAPRYSGGDLPESTVEALSVLSGGAPPMEALPLTCSAGRVAGGCWRGGAQRVVVVMTDALAHNGPDPASAGLLNPYGVAGRALWPDVQTQLTTDGTTLIVLLNSTSGTTRGQYAEMVTDLSQPVANRVNGTTLGTGCDTVVTQVRAAIGR